VLSGQFGHQIGRFGPSRTVMVSAALDFGIADQIQQSFEDGNAISAAEAEPGCVGGKRVREGPPIVVHLPNSAPLG
jgi:hypothetical protein